MRILAVADRKLIKRSKKYNRTLFQKLAKIRGIEKREDKKQIVRVLKYGGRGERIHG